MVSQIHNKNDTGATMFCFTYPWPAETSKMLPLKFGTNEIIIAALSQNIRAAHLFIDLYRIVYN